MGLKRKVYLWKDSPVDRFYVAADDKAGNFTSLIYADNETLAALYDEFKQANIPVEAEVLNEEATFLLTVDVQGDRKYLDRLLKNEAIKKAGITAELSQDGKKVVFKALESKSAVLAKLGKELEDNKYSVSRDVIPGREVAALRVRGQGDESALLNRLTSRQYVRGTPETHVEDTELARRAGLAYLGGDTLSIAAGFKRGAMGEATMGMGFMAGTLGLAFGQEGQASAQQVHEQLQKDISSGNSLDFTRQEFTQIGRGKGAVTDTARDFLAGNYVEIMAAANWIAGILAFLEGAGLGDPLHGFGEKHGAKKYELEWGEKNRAQIMATELFLGSTNDIKLDPATGKPSLERHVDIPLMISGALIGTGFGVATFVPAKWSDKEPWIKVDELPLMGPAVKALGNTAIGKGFNRLVEGIQEAPRKFGGLMARTHNLQNITLSFVDLAVKKYRVLGEYATKFSDELKDAVNDPEVTKLLAGKELLTEGARERDLGLTEAISKLFRREVDKAGTTYSQLTLEAKQASHAVIAEYDAKDLAYRAAEARLAIGLRENESVEQLRSQVEATKQALDEMKEDPRLKAAFKIAMYDLRDTPVRKNGEVVVENRTETIAGKAVTVPVEKLTAFEKFIKLHNEQLDAGGASKDKAREDDALYKTALHRVTYDKAYGDRYLSLWRIAYNGFFVVANTLFSHLDKGEGDVFRASEKAIDYGSLVDMGSQLLSNNDKANDLAAIKTVAEGYAAQKDVHLSAEELARQIEAKLQTGKSLNEQKALAMLGIGQEVAQVNGHAQEQSLSQKVGQRGIASIKPNSLDPAAIAEGARDAMPLGV